MGSKPTQHEKLDVIINSVASLTGSIGELVAVFNREVANTPVEEAVTPIPEANTPIPEAITPVPEAVVESISDTATVSDLSVKQLMDLIDSRTAQVAKPKPRILKSSRVQPLLYTDFVSKGSKLDATIRAINRMQKNQDITVTHRMFKMLNKAWSRSAYEFITVDPVTRIGYRTRKPNDPNRATVDDKARFMVKVPAKVVSTSGPANWKRWPDVTITLLAHEPKSN